MVFLHGEKRERGESGRGGLWEHVYWTWEGVKTKLNSHLQHSVNLKVSLFSLYYPLRIYLLVKLGLGNNLDSTSKRQLDFNASCQVI